MKYDAFIEIFGTLDDADNLDLLANAAASEGGLTWEQGLLPSTAATDILESLEEGKPLTLYVNEQDRTPFPMVRRVCQSAGLSYVMNLGPAGDEGFDMAISWKPGWDEECDTPIGAQGLPSIPFAELEEAVSQGLDRVRELMTSAKSGLLLEEDRSLTLSPDMELPRVSRTAAPRLG